MPKLEDLLRTSATSHQRLCPRQVLGVRMGLLGGRWLDLPVPREDKRLLTLVETDGCAADAIAVATGCRVGLRTLRVIDFTKEEQILFHIAQQVLGVDVLTHLGQRWAKRRGIMILTERNVSGG